MGLGPKAEKKPEPAAKAKPTPTPVQNLKKASVADARTKTATPEAPKIAEIKTDPKAFKKV